MVVDVAFRGVDLLVSLDVVDPSGATVRLRADVRSGATLTPGSSVTVIAPDDHLVPLPR
jgi:hypothetical protein